jgi:hypothetical protein
VSHKSNVLDEAPNLSQPWWAQDIWNACVLAEQAPPERRLVVFLGGLTAETLRLVGADSPEGFEAVIHAAICLRVMFTGSPIAASDEELDEWGSRIRVILITESLQRQGYVQVDYTNSVMDPLSFDLPYELTWPESLQKVEVPA